MPDQAALIRDRLDREDRAYCAREGIADLPPAAMRFRVIGDCSIEEHTLDHDPTPELKAALSQVRLWMMPQRQL